MPKVTKNPQLQKSTILSYNFNLYSTVNISKNITREQKDEKGKNTNLNIDSIKKNWRADEIQELTNKDKKR